MTDIRPAIPVPRRMMTEGQRREEIQRAKDARAKLRLCLGDIERQCAAFASEAGSLVADAAYHGIADADGDTDGVDAARAGIEALHARAELALAALRGGR